MLPMTVNTKVTYITHAVHFTRWNPTSALGQMAFIFRKVSDTLQTLNDAIGIDLLQRMPAEYHIARRYGTDFASAAGPAPRAVNEHDPFLFPTAFCLAFPSCLLPILSYQEPCHLRPWAYCNHSVIGDIKMKLLSIHEGLENQIQ